MPPTKPGGIAIAIAIAIITRNQTQWRKENFSDRSLQVKSVTKAEKLQD